MIHWLAAGASHADRREAGPQLISQHAGAVRRDPQGRTHLLNGSSLHDQIASPITLRVGEFAAGGYQAKIDGGFVEHVPKRIPRRGQPDKLVESVAITAKGLARLAELRAGACSPPSSGR